MKKKTVERTTPFEPPFVEVDASFPQPLARSLPGLFVLLLHSGWASATRESLSRDRKGPFDGARALESKVVFLCRRRVSLPAAARNSTTACFPSRRFHSLPHLERVHPLALLVERVHEVHPGERSAKEKRKRMREAPAEKKEENRKSVRIEDCRLPFFLFLFRPQPRPSEKPKLSSRFTFALSLQQLKYPQPGNQQAARSSSRAGRQAAPCKGTRRSGRRRPSRSCRSCSVGSRAFPW